MRAVVMQDRKIHVADIPEPVAGSGEVVVEVLRAGICGSDLHGAAHGAEFNAATRAAFGAEMMDLSEPIVFGHEFVCRVVAHGPDTEGRIPVGRRVVSMPALVRNPPAFVGFGGTQVPGAYAERILLSEPLLIEVPDDTSSSPDCV